MQRQKGGIFLILLLLLLGLGAGLFLRYMQISQIKDPLLFELVQQHLKAELRKGDLKGLYQSLEQADLAVMADRAMAMVKQEIVVTGINAARPLLDFSEQGETRFRVDFNIEEEGSIKQQGVGYLRFVKYPGQGWRYLGKTDAAGFYRTYLSRSRF